MQINKNGIIYMFKREENEINEMFYKRCWISTKFNPKNEKELEKSIKLSKLLINKQYYGCEYSSDIEKKIDEFHIGK